MALNRDGYSNALIDAISPGSENDTCLATDSSPAMFLQTATYGDSSSLVTLYDQAVLRSVPVLTTVWSKNNTLTSGPWSDVRLVCLRAGNISAGSQIPTLSSEAEISAKSWTLLITCVGAVLAFISLG
jgi:hypothetical protein